MITENILAKINELFENTPRDIGVAYGFKKVNKEFTDEKCIIFNVVKKLPLSEIPESDVLPSTIEIDGVTYNTDVNEVGHIKFLACDNTSSNPCYPYGVPPDPYLTPNSQKQRPLKGGSVTANVFATGTLGFIAKHTATGKIVGITNSHVAYGVEYNDTSLQFPGNQPISLNSNSITAYQAIPQSSTDVYVPENEYGKTLYVKKLKRYPFYNQVDGAVIGLLQKDPTGLDLITAESWKQIGLNIGTTPPLFATTAELDNLLADPLLEVVSSGLRTGPKQGACGLRIESIGAALFLTTGHYFTNCISVTRINPDCYYAIESGDSGSAVLAKINGVWKIIGLAFASPENGIIGYVCRIDYIAPQLGIQAWDGTITPTSFVNFNSIDVITTPGVSGEDSITVNGKVYRQGVATNAAPNYSTTTTTTLPPTTTSTTTSAVNTVYVKYSIY